MAINPTAIIHPTAELADSVEVGPYAHIGPHTKLGENCVVMQGAFIGPRVVAGKENVFHPYCMVGQDPQFLGFNPETNSGTIVGDGNHFREFCTIHRGLKEGQNTLLGDANYFMAYSHVAHDCIVGSHVVMVNYAAISGHTELEDRVFFSGHSSTHQFCRVGTLAMVGGHTAVPKDVPPYMTIKLYGVLVGLNTVGLRRAGVGPETRVALKHAYKELFRSGRPVSRSIELLRGEWDGKEMPPEMKKLLDFCAVRGKRGLSHGPRADTKIPEETGSDE